MFLLWAIGQQLVGLPASAVPSPRADSPAETEDHSVRAALARRLLHGDDAPPDIRVAGLLVVLFGQHLSRIVRLERAAARTGPPAIKLGRDWLDLPDPMGQHLKDLVNARSPGTTVFGGDHWLFPGQRPGSHLSEASLARRLGEYGISARAMRNAALFHLASIVRWSCRCGAGCPPRVTPALMSPAESSWRSLTTMTCSCPATCTPPCRCSAAVTPMPPTPHA
jgi:hypothetical protein